MPVGFSRSIARTQQSTGESRGALAGARRLREPVHLQCDHCATNASRAESMRLQGARTPATRGTRGARTRITNMSKRVLGTSLLGNDS